MPRAQAGITKERVLSSFRPWLSEPVVRSSLVPSIMLSMVPLGWGGSSKSRSSDSPSGGDCVALFCTVVKGYCDGGFGGRHGRRRRIAPLLAFVRVLLLWRGNDAVRKMGGGDGLSVRWWMCYKIRVAIV
mmetsp:Transcript_43936/g.131719  ORF Transcript_43936/g.131719 Transcript_43936/m.131719 type:complete len:130 (+) Transcript_43936:4496-4885(+)